MLFKRNNVKVKVYHVSNECFSAWATDGKLNVYNCYGSTKEAAKEMAMLRLGKMQEERVYENNRTFYQ